MAEVLITLAIIGVVAAITLPALITNIQDRVKEKRVQNIQQKFSKATDKMLSISGLNGYESTLDFVNELKNHLSIAKICENDELRNCWPTEKVTLSDGTEWEISKTKTGKTLKMTNDAEHEWSDTVGLITGDGTSMILSYNTKCDIDPTKTTVWSSDKSSSTNCVAAVFDWNGSSKPNQFGTPRADVLALNATGLGRTCAFETSEGKCLQPAQVIGANDYLTKAQCNELKGTLGINACYSSNSSKDYWAWAVKECGGVAKMASMEDLAEIASKIYGYDNTAWDEAIGASYSKGSNYDSTIASSLGLNLPSPSFWVWSGRELNRSNAYNRLFGSSTSYYDYNHYRSSSSGLFMCKTD